MSHPVIVVFGLALAGFLFGGAYSTWKTVRWLAVALAVCGVLSAVAALAWVV
ncbi:hypothetical protein [Nocardia stercoris]|uniref:hypothetical protein n=1 Tax=Nocardia stercoris TaxID=2483361 RepID=UPI0018F3D2ED|nr:hypothetical protein [Nocardia stercoris]